MDCGVAGTGRRHCELQNENLYSAVFTGCRWMAARAGAVRIALSPLVIPSWLMSHSECESRLLSHHMMDATDFIQKMIAFTATDAYLSFWLLLLGSFRVQC